MQHGGRQASLAQKGKLGSEPSHPTFFVLDPVMYSISNALVLFLSVLHQLNVVVTSFVHIPFPKLPECWLAHPVTADYNANDF